MKQLAKSRNERWEKIVTRTKCQDQIPVYEYLLSKQSNTKTLLSRSENPTKYKSFTKVVPKFRFFGQVSTKYQVYK